MNSSSTENFRNNSTPDEVNETIIEANATDWSIDQIPEERMLYMYTYTILMGLFMFFIFTRTFSFFHICLRVSKNLHDQLFRGVTRATMQFFNNNPSGRILNRFSKDIGAVDSFLPYALIECVVVCFNNGKSLASVILSLIAIILFFSSSWISLELC